MPFEIRTLRSGDEQVLARIAPDVLDHAIDEQATRAFLADPGHHLAVAMEDGIVVGFASAIHYNHPDKPVPELWVNEVGVASTHRGRGVGKALLRSLFHDARALGCSEAWVLTKRTNDAAMRLYTSVGGTEPVGSQVMFMFHLDAHCSNGGQDE